jgi:hypothetical protein
LIRRGGGEEGVAGEVIFDIDLDDVIAEFEEVSFDGSGELFDGFIVNFKFNE